MNDKSRIAIFVKRNEKILRIMAIVPIIIAYLCLVFTIELVIPENNCDILTFLLIVYGYPAVWCIVAASSSGNKTKRKSKRVFMLAVAIFLIYMMYIISYFSSRLYNSEIPVVTFIVIHIGIAFAFAQPISEFYLRRLLERNEEKKKILRKKEILRVEDLYAFLEIDDTVGLAKVLTKHEDVEIRQKAIDILFEAQYHYIAKRYLVRALEDVDEYIRMKSAALLFIYRDMRGLDILVEKFHDLSDDIRLEVIKWVPEQDEKGIKALLHQALDDESRAIRDLAKVYLSDSE